MDLSLTLKSNYQGKHKSKPGQFVSIIDGRLKRASTTQKYRKSFRICVVDGTRDLSPSCSPAPLTAVQVKMQQRRQHLQQWKEEKEMKKKKDADKKKKPFLVSVIRPPIAFEPPPPVKQPTSTATRRVTRSQVANKQKEQSKPIKLNTTSTQNANKYSIQSFAPEYAPFRPPQIKGSLSVPAVTSIVCVGNKVISRTKKIISFDPVEPKINKPAHKYVPPNIKVHSSDNVISTSRATRGTRCNTRAVMQIKKEVEVKVENSTKAKTVKNSNKNMPNSKPQTAAKTGLNNKDMPDRQVVEVDLCTPSKVIPRSESSSEERLRLQAASALAPPVVPVPYSSQLSPDQIREEVASMSPRVTVARGKNRVRQEIKEKLKDGMLADDVGDSKTVQHFRNQLDCEIKRMTALCDMWDKYSTENHLPDHGLELILTAVGQARLLMSKKLQQFSQLVEQCAAGHVRPGEGAVHTTDLQGFWDMVFMQVENIDVRFKQLNELRERNWVVLEKPKIRKPPPKNSKKAPPTRPATSQLKAMIQAARKAAQRQEQGAEPVLEKPEEGRKSFEAGFFSVQTPIRQNNSALHTPKNNSLLKNVLSSEARKASASRGSASRAIMRASFIARNMAIEGVEPIPLTPLPSVNLNATPARSILKSPTEAQKKGPKKSLKTVLFEQDVDIPLDQLNLNTESPYITPIDFLPDISPVRNIPQITKTRESMSRKSETKSPSRQRRSRLNRSPALDQENIIPYHGTSPKRVTRNMRRSALLDTPVNEPTTPRLSPKKAALETPRRRSTRNRSVLVD